MNWVSDADKPKHLWCPVCKAGWTLPLSQREADEHLIVHVGEGRWPNADQVMANEAFGRRLAEHIAFLVEDRPKCLDLLERLARVTGAMAQDTVWHDQMFDIVADIEAAQLEERKNADRTGG